METEEKKKKPVYKKKWFWIVIAVVLVIGIIGNAVKDDDSDVAEGPSASPSAEAPAPTHTEKPADSSSQGTDDVVSLDTLCTLIEGTSLTDFSGHSITHDENSIIVCIWQEGITAEVYAAQAGQVEDYKDSWNNAKDSIVSLAGSIRNFMDTMGRDDVSLIFNVLNDQNLDNTLLMIADTTVIYDVLAD